MLQPGGDSGDDSGDDRLTVMMREEEEEERSVLRAYYGLGRAEPFTQTL